MLVSPAPEPHEPSSLVESWGTSANHKSHPGPKRGASIITSVQLKGTPLLRPSLEIYLEGYATEVWQLSVQASPIDTSHGPLLSPIPVHPSIWLGCPCLNQLAPRVLNDQLERRSTKTRDEHISPPLRSSLATSLSTLESTGGLALGSNIPNGFDVPLTHLAVLLKNRF